MRSPRTDPSTEGGVGLEGLDMALADLPTHPFLALEASQSQSSNSQGKDLGSSWLCLQCTLSLGESLCSGPQFPVPEMGTTAFGIFG